MSGEIGVSYDLLEIVRALQAPRSLARRFNRRQQMGDEEADRDSADDRETATRRLVNAHNPHRGAGFASPVVGSLACTEWHGNSFFRTLRVLDGCRAGGAGTRQDFFDLQCGAETMDVKAACHWHCQ